jgi:hypothetical protein
MRLLFSVAVIPNLDPEAVRRMQPEEVYLLQPDLVVRFPVVAVWRVGRPRAV